MVQQASNGIIKAVQQGSVAHAEMGRKWVWAGTGEGQGSVEGVAGFKWKVWGLAQGCRQIHEWEVGRVLQGGGRGGWQGKEGQC